VFSAVEDGIQDRSDNQGQQGGKAQTEDDGHRHTLKKCVGGDRSHAQHRRQRCHGDWANPAYGCVKDGAILRFLSSLGFQFELLNEDNAVFDQCADQNQDAQLGEEAESSRKVSGPAFRKDKSAVSETTTVPGKRRSRLDWAVDTSDIFTGRTVAFVMGRSVSLHPVAANTNYPRYKERLVCMLLRLFATIWVIFIIADNKIAEAIWHRVVLCGIPGPVLYM